MNRKVSTAEELLELIRSAVKDVDHSINEAVSNLKEAKAYAEDIEHVYANDLYNLAERGKEEREINATSLDLVWKDRKSTRLNSSHSDRSRMPSSA